MTSIGDRIAADTTGRILIDLLLQQQLVRGSEPVAQALAPACKIVSHSAGDVLIRQGDSDNDIYFMFSGSARILINEREVATRGAGQHVGEMALVDPASRRTATVVSREPTTYAQVCEPNFVAIANAHPILWRQIGIQLVRRLDERCKFHSSPNETPQLFIGSSREGIAIAKALASRIDPKLAVVSLWSEGVFGASHFPMEDLATRVQCSDFAALVATADDQVTSRGVSTQAPRDNIVFELGLFMGAITRHRTFLITPQGIDVKIPSDLLGINVVKYDPTAASPQDAVRTSADEISLAIQKMKSR
ncbi:MAG: cyclic nucleotide-binding domain-containing protein [Kiritimatiellaceae bacterium]|nr:cyclic nucleotide-binding domain-containing protein [Kiritimatiellaceae bacterium]